MAIRNTTLNDTHTTIFSSIGSSSAVTAIYLCNKSLGVVSFGLFALPVGEVAGTDNMIYYDVEIAPKDTYVLDTERLIFDDGESLVGIASTAGTIVATISYTSL